MWLQVHMSTKLSTVIYNGKSHINIVKLSSALMNRLLFRYIISIFQNPHENRGFPKFVLVGNGIVW